MAEVDTSVTNRSIEAIKVFAALGRVRAAYLFGSHVEGKPGPWSDIDIAIFADDVEQWDIERRADAMVFVQKSIGDDVEIHLFPALHAKNPPQGSFAQYVMKHGTPITIEHLSGGPDDESLQAT